MPEIIILVVALGFRLRRQEFGGLGHVLEAGRNYRITGAAGYTPIVFYGAKGTLQVGGQRFPAVWTWSSAMGSRPKIRLTAT